jgi:SIR2-like protein
MTIDPVMDIPGNFRVLQQLLELLQQKNAVAFVGAGASADLYHNWQDLIGFLASEAKERGIATDEEQNFWSRYASRRPQQIVRAINHAFGNQRVFEDILEKYFAYRTHPETGHAYTPLHQAIVELPFKGLVTTNYDPGIYEALKFCRPEIHISSNTWKDDHYVQDWYKGYVFKEGMYPLLYAHGVWNRPDTIILDNDRYREAYGSGPYLRAFEYLWGARNLVIIGFGFSDSWMDRLLDNILGSIITAGDMMHIALMPLHREDKNCTKQLRDLMQDAYNASVLFYLVDQKEIAGRQVEDHSALVSFLRRLRTILLKSESSISVDQFSLLNKLDE